MGTEHTIRLHSCLRLKPVIEGLYYDYEWGYLNQNLSRLDAQPSVYQHLGKLTKSAHNYPSFVNQEILDLKGSTHLVFEINSQRLQVPVVLLL